MYVRIIALNFILVFSSCRLPTSQFEVIVQLEEVLPVSAVAQKRTLIYKVVAPVDLRGRYGIATTRVSDTEAREKLGALYRLNLTEKDRYILSEVKPLGGSDSATDDFFQYAKPTANDKIKVGSDQ